MTFALVVLPAVVGIANMTIQFVRDLRASREVGTKKTVVLDARLLTQEECIEWVTSKDADVLRRIDREAMHRFRLSQSAMGRSAA